MCLVVCICTPMFKQTCTMCKNMLSWYWSKILVYCRGWNEIIEEKNKNVLKCARRPISPCNSGFMEIQLNTLPTQSKGISIAKCISHFAWVLMSWGWSTKLGLTNHRAEVLQLRLGNDRAGPNGTLIAESSLILFKWREQPGWTREEERSCLDLTSP